VLPVSIDDISFLAPVDIGSLLSFKAEVVYVEGGVLRMLVLVESGRKGGRKYRGGRPSRVGGSLRRKRNQDLGNDQQQNAAIRAIRSTKTLRHYRL
jgi:hypothetical protein